MKFCPVVPEICRGQVHVPKKEKRKRRKRIRLRLRIIIIRNGAKTISLTEKICQCCFHLNSPGKWPV
jgi:hypothetical protein